MSGTDAAGSPGRLSALGRLIPHGIIRRLAALWLAVLGLLALLAPLLPLPDPIVASGDYFQPPGGRLVLGADQLGRDMLSRLIWGARTSFRIVIAATVIAGVVGIALGMLAGYFRGWLDWLITGVIDLVLAVPGLLMLIVITSLRGASVGNLVLGLCVVGTPAYVRLARANTMNWMQREFVLSARALGARHGRVMARHILPNVLPSVSAYALSAAALIFVIEGSLSFLGLGVPRPNPAWGSMIEGGRSYLTESPHIVLIPSLVLSLTILAFNILGDRGRRRSVGGQ